MNRRFRKNKAASDVEEQRENNVGSTTARPKKAGGRSGKGFLPGRSGNPGGRPKGTSITAALRALIDDDGPDSVARVLLRLAQSGDVGAIRLILDRVEGQVKEHSDHGGEVTIRVVYDDPFGPDTAAFQDPDQPDPAPEVTPEA